MDNSLKIIAYIHNDFPTKFGVPRQSTLTDLESTIVFEPEYRDDNALRGIEQFSHLWLIWDFSLSHRSNWSPTVRPPRLGGNTRMGVFATRSPFRPNPIGLSSVKLIGIEKTQNGTVLKVLGADLLDGTPIYDIKPYLSFTDSHPDAIGGFADTKKSDNLKINFPTELKNLIPSDKIQGLISLLSQDPRPHYIDDSDRVYGFDFAEFQIKFRVSDGTLEVLEVVKKGAK